MFIKYKFPYKTYLGLVAFFILINLLMGSSGATIVDALVLCVWSVMGIVSGMEIYKFYKVIFCASFLKNKRNEYFIRNLNALLR